MLPLIIASCCGATDLGVEGMDACHRQPPIGGPSADRRPDSGRPRLMPLHRGATVGFAGVDAHPTAGDELVKVRLLPVGATAAASSKR
jgi:hypothetical protein